MRFFTEALIEQQRQRRLSNEEWVQERLRWEDWERLMSEAIEFAKRELGRRKWGGKSRGVLPGGYDAESVASEAIGELLSGKGRVAAGFVPERVTRELKRLVRQVIRGLQRRREASLTVSEWEVLREDESNPGTIFEQLESGQADGLEVLAQKEGEEERSRLVGDFAKSLVADAELSKVLAHFRSEVRDPVELAKRMGVSVKEAQRLKWRLRWRAKQFAKSWRTGKGAPGCTAAQRNVNC